MLTDEDKTNLMVTECQHLIDTMMKVYEPEEAKNKWDQIADILGPNIKNLVFISALKGENDLSRIIMLNVDPEKAADHVSYSKIHAIKTIRWFASCTLTEAKQWYEDCAMGKMIELTGRASARRQALQELKDAGVEVF